MVLRLRPTVFGPFQDAFLRPSDSLRVKNCESFISLNIKYQNNKFKVNSKHLKIFNVAHIFIN